MVLKTHYSGQGEVLGWAATVTGSRSQAMGIALHIEGRLAIGMVLGLSFIIKSMGNTKGFYNMGVKWSYLN